MNRLPSRRTLSGMSNDNRWSTLDAFARDLRRELDDAQTARHRRDARRKLDHVYAAANDFGDFVGQPDRLRVRVPAASRQMTA